MSVKSSRVRKNNILAPRYFFQSLGQVVILSRRRIGALFGSSRSCKIPGGMRLERRRCRIFIQLGPTREGMLVIHSFIFRGAGPYIILHLNFETQRLAIFPDFNAPCTYSFGKVQCSGWRKKAIPDPLDCCYFSTAHPDDRILFCRLPRRSQARTQGDSGVGNQN